MDTPTTSEDRDEIRDLLARFNHALDAKRTDELIGLFVDGGVFELAGVTTMSGEGMHALTDLIQPGTRHVIANEVIDIDGDTATVQAYMTVFGGPAPGVIRTLAGYVDSVVRVDGRWRFARRICSPDA